jgi:DNA-binding transcriptional ArsR family regulator
MTYDGSFGPEALDDAARVLEALAHPARLRIVCGLLDERCCVGSMVECLGLPQAYVSRHLAVLREAGVVTAVPEGRQRVYRVTHPAVAPLVAALRGTLSPPSTHGAST